MGYFLRSGTLLRMVATIALFALGCCQCAMSRQTVAVASQAGGSATNPQGGAIWISARHTNGATAELVAADLEVKIDGKAASVGDVRRMSPTLRYCLLLDISGSTRAARKTQYDTAVALLSKIPRAGHDYGVLVEFNDQAYLDAEGTDPQKLTKAITQDERSSTSLYDAMVACSDELAKGDASAGAGEMVRAMFVLSDGEDNSSRMSREGAERDLVAGGIRVYSIGQTAVGSHVPGEAAKAGKTLKQFAEATGGKNYLPAKDVTLEKIVDDISSDLANLYAVTLSSQGAMQADRFYKLEVKCRKKDFAITAPREYSVPLRRADHP